MRQLREILTAAAVGDREYVLGTVVDVRGSSYRKPGARVLIADDGSRVGLISGGCLEKDVVRNAFAWTADGPQVVLYDTRGDRLKPQGDYGTGCEGMIWLLLERWPRPGAVDPLRAIENVWETGESAVVATVYDGGPVGERYALHTPVSSRIHRALFPHMRAAIHWSRPRSVELKFEAETVSVLVEPLHPPPELLVFGAGDDAQPLVRIASTMGWTTRVADKWPALVTRERFPHADELFCEPVEKLADHLALRPTTNVVVMTHNLSDDATLLGALLDSDVRYIGLLGPRRRTARLMQMLAQRDELPTPQDLERLQTPVGLDLGGDSPEEVALSIVAAITAERNERVGGFLRESEGPIHPEHLRIVEEVE